MVDLLGGLSGKCHDTWTCMSPDRCHDIEQHVMCEPHSTLGFGPSAVAYSRKKESGISISACGVGLPPKSLLIILNFLFMNYVRIYNYLPYEIGIIIFFWFKGIVICQLSMSNF